MNNTHTSKSPFVVDHRLGLKWEPFRTGFCTLFDAIDVAEEYADHGHTMRVRDIRTGKTEIVPEFSQRMRAITEGKTPWKYSADAKVEVV